MSLCLSWSRFLQNVPEYSKMHAECSRMHTVTQEQITCSYLLFLSSSREFCSPCLPRTDIKLAWEQEENFVNCTISAMFVCVPQNKFFRPFAVSCWIDFCFFLGDVSTKIAFQDKLNFLPPTGATKMLIFVCLFVCSLRSVSGQSQVSLSTLLYSWSLKYFVLFSLFK